MLWVRLGFAVFGMFWGTWAVAALDIQEFLELSSSGLGLLVAATVVGTSVANVIGGALTERIGVGRAAALSLVLWAATLVPLAAVRASGAWMASFLLAVAAGGLLDVVLNIASTVTLADRPGRLLRVHAGYNTGALTGAAITGALLAAGWSWRWTFALVAVAAAALSVSVARTPRHLDVSTPTEHATVRDAAAELRRSGLLPLAGVFSLGAMVEGGIGTFGVLYLREQLAVAVLAGAGAYVAGQALATVTRLSLGSANLAAGIQRGGGVRAARAGLAVAAAGLALEAATTVPAVAAVGLAFAAVGATTYWPLLSAAASKESARPGLAVGGVSAAGYLGFLVGPPLVGVVADAGGLRAGVFALAGAAALAAVAPLRRQGKAAVDPRTTPTGRRASRR